MPVPDVPSSSPTVWHAVRPWTPRFKLFVREITSVSATFVLTSAARSTNNIGEHGLDDEDNTLDPGSRKSLPIPLEDQRETDLSIVSEAINRGLNVTVNGAQWKRVLMRMDEANGEAVIVLFGLMPARQYDIELGIVIGDADGEEVVHSRMVTQSQQCGQSPPEAEGDRSLDSISSVSSFTSESNAPPRTHQPSFEEYAAGLRNTLAQLNAEHATLQAQMKSARRDAQKADGALRSEIESLKRAADKHSAAETRGRQKILALQEAVKQAIAATQETEEAVKELEAELPAVRAKEVRVSALHSSTTAEAERHQSEYDAALQNDKAKTSALSNELNALTTRLEKLKAKKEKLSSEIIPELEAELEKLVREVALVERDAGAFEVIDTGPVGVGLSSSRSSSTRITPTSSTGVLAPVGTPRPANLPPKPQVTRTLSSRAPPFDPGSAFRHAPQRPPLAQISKSSGSSTVNLSVSHSYTQSLDVGRPTINIGPVRPVSPSRQASLPMKMPSYSGQDR